MSDPLIEVEDLTIQYQTPKGPLTAVSNASFSIDEREYFGLVGESGCGKSTLAKALLGGLDDNGFVESGTIKLRGREIQGLSEKELNQEIRWKEISYIPQGSMSSLDPLQRISEQAAEIAKVHSDLPRKEAIGRFEDMLEVVGISRERVDDYPHQFSGGMQQRAIIALALFLEPSFIIADEPTTALDVIMEDQIMKYLEEARDELDTSMLLITHDISVVFETCDRMAVMHAGQISETGTVQEVYESPLHPYSILLQNAFPDITQPHKELEVIEGYPPQEYGEVDYCTFVDRCPWAVEECQEAPPPLEPLPGEDSHQAACFRKEENLREQNEKMRTETDQQ